MFSSIFVGLIFCFISSSSSKTKASKSIRADNNMEDLFVIRSKLLSPSSTHTETHKEEHRQRPMARAGWSNGGACSCGCGRILSCNHLSSSSPPVLVSILHANKPKERKRRSTGSQRARVGHTSEGRGRRLARRGSCSLEGGGAAASIARVIRERWDRGWG